MPNRSRHVLAELLKLILMVITVSVIIALVSAVSYDSGELGFLPPLVSVRVMYSLRFVGLP